VRRESEHASRIEAYVRARYVVGARVTHIDEAEAVRVLDAHLSRSGAAAGESCGYLGILWFEVSFIDGEDQRRCLDRARMWLSRARSRCEAPWEAVEERLADVDAMLDV
jgi:hypothetical protein